MSGSEKTSGNPHVAEAAWEAGPPPEVLLTDDGRRLAYHRLAAKASADRPGVVFLTGFKSDMTGGKAVFLEEVCRREGLAFLRFDYTGHGASSGEFLNGAIGDWAADAITAIDALTKGPQILVGSSMGGWIMLLAALALKPRIAGLVGIAAAPDFTEDLMWDTFDEGQRAVLMRDGHLDLPNEYDDGAPYRITRRLIEDGRENLLLRGDIEIDVPVRLIQGMADADVPWKTSLRIAEKLMSTDVEVTLVKGGGHRLSEPRDLARLERTLLGMLATNAEEAA